ncbi:MAG: hypothetical protein ACOYB2_03030 [Limnohabitans sp.]
MQTNINPPSLPSGEASKQIDSLKAEWAKAPFMTKQMAGAYIGPLLDLLETMRLDTALLSAELEGWKAERAASLAHLIKMIEEGEAMGVPEWVIEKMKAAVEVTNG